MARCHVMSRFDAFLIICEFDPVLPTTTFQSVPKVVSDRERGWLLAFYMATSSKPNSAESYYCPSTSSSSHIDKNKSTHYDAEISTCGNSTKPSSHVCEQDLSFQNGASLAAFGNPGLKNEIISGTPTQLENSVPDNVDRLGSMPIPPFKRARTSQGQPGYAANDHIQEQKPLGMSWWLAPKDSTPQSPFDQEDKQDSRVGNSTPLGKNDCAFANKEIDFMFQHPAQNHEDLSGKHSTPIIMKPYDESGRNLSAGHVINRPFFQEDLPQHWLASSILSKESSALRLGGMLGDTVPSPETNRRSFVQWKPSICNASSRAVDGPSPQVSPVQGWNQQRTLHVTQVTSGTSFSAGTPGRGITNFDQFFPVMLPPRGFVPYFLPGLDAPASAFSGNQSHVITQGQYVHIPEPKAFMPSVSETLLPHINYDTPLSISATTMPKSLTSSVFEDHGNKIITSPGNAHAARGSPSLCRPAEQTPLVDHQVLPSIPVVMEGQTVMGRICLEELANYRGLAHAIRTMFGSSLPSADLNLPGGTCDLGNAIPGCRIAYEDDEGDLLLVGDLPWRDFVQSARRVKVVPSKSKGKR